MVVRCGSNVHPGVVPLDPSIVWGMLNEFSAVLAADDAWVPTLGSRTVVFGIALAFEEHFRGLRLTDPEFAARAQQMVSRLRSRCRRREGDALSRQGIAQMLVSLLPQRARIRCVYFCIHLRQ
jgi:hypothetical protein